MSGDKQPQKRFHIATRGSFKRLLILFLVIAVSLVLAYATMIRMPGKSFTGSLPPLTDSQRLLAAELHRDVIMLADEIGPRCIAFPRELEQSAAFIEAALTDAGFVVERQTFDVQGHACHNIIAQITGFKAPQEIVVVGAHYDSCFDTPAANDNGSGVAATLALARRFAGSTVDRTLRFVLFVNEEPPYFQTRDMGSLVYAQACHARDENIVAMLSLETIGYYSDEPGSQLYPIKPIGWLYPDQGNFIAFVGNFGSRGLVRQTVGTFRKNVQFPSEGAALPGWITGVGWSDHWAFWQAGYLAVMVTDTAPFRYPHYHQPSDTPEKLDYDRMARVVEGLQAVVTELVNPAGRPR